MSEDPLTPTAVTELAKNMRGPAPPSDAIIRTSWKRRANGEFARELSRGLALSQKQIDSRFLYDKRGSELFEAITEQPEYYQTRTEAALLSQYADDIIARVGPLPMVELGSGSSKKTRHLIDAFLRMGAGCTYVPVDVSEEALAHARRTLKGTPHMRCLPVHGTYETALELLAAQAPAFGVFLGSSIGNMSDIAESRIFDGLARALAKGGFFLLGVDLVKQRDILEAAYNDAAGVTAAFTRNLFYRMNRELGTVLSPELIEHVAEWSPQRERIEIFARFNEPQSIISPALDHPVTLKAGERIRTEICRKYRLETLIPRLSRHDLRMEDVFVDEKSWFALLLVRHNNASR